MSQSFSALLRRLLKKHFRTSKAFALALGIKPSHLSHAMGRGGQPFDMLRCLKLARLTHTHPSTVLRAAGKTEIATLIDELYGPARELSTTEQTLLKNYAATQDESILNTVRTLLEIGAQRAQKGRHKRRSGRGGEGGGGITDGGADAPETKPPTEIDITKDPGRVHHPAIYPHRARAR